MRATGQLAVFPYISAFEKASHVAVDDGRGHEEGEDQIREHAVLKGSDGIRLVPEYLCGPGELGIFDYVLYQAGEERQEVVVSGGRLTHPFAMPIMACEETAVYVTRLTPVLDEYTFREHVALVPCGSGKLGLFPVAFCGCLLLRLVAVNLFNDIKIPLSNGCKPWE